MKPEFCEENCPYCGDPCVMLRLPQPGNDFVAWCEAGHVVVFNHNAHRPKVVYDFHKEEL